MGATKDVAIERKDGTLIPFPVKTLTKIYGGTFVSVDATGYAVPGDDAAGQIFQGVADEQVDNSAGGNGDAVVRLWRRGLFKATLDTAITQANVGDNVFLVDDETVDLAANTDNDIFCGVIAEFIDTTHAWIDIEPAIKQADVATHIADTTNAHGASAIGIGDAGEFTSESDAEAALQEIYQHLVSAQKFIGVPLFSLIEGDGTNTVAALGPATTPKLDMANGDTDSGLLVTWAAENVDPVLFQVPLPPDLNTGKDLVIHLRAKMGGATDTPVINSDAYFNEGDTKVEDASAALGAAYAEKTITIAAADIPAGAQTLTVELTPGAHDNDTIVLSALWIEYQAQLLTS